MGPGPGASEAQATARLASRRQTGDRPGATSAVPSTGALLERARGDLAGDGASRHELRRSLALIVPVVETLQARVEDLSGQLARARTCPVTGLPTRSAWTAEAQGLIAGVPAAVALIDLDGFKPVNDSFGHDAGDAVLAALGKRLNTWAQDEGAAVGRLGGDEFVVAIADRPDLAARIQNLHTLLTEPVSHQGRTLAVGASIGVARSADLAGPDEVAGPLSALLKYADAAMYLVKGHGRRGRRFSRILPAPLRRLAGARMHRGAIAFAAER